MICRREIYYNKLDIMRHVCIFCPSVNWQWLSIITDRNSKFDMETAHPLYLNILDEICLYDILQILQ